MEDKSDTELDEDLEKSDLIDEMGVPLKQDLPKK